MTGVVFKVEVVKLDKADAERRRWLPNMQFKWIVLLYLLGNLSGGVHQLPGGRSDREDLLECCHHFEQVSYRKCPRPGHYSSLFHNLWARERLNGPLSIMDQQVVKLRVVKDKCNGHSWLGSVPVRPTCMENSLEIYLLNTS